MVNTLLLIALTLAWNPSPSPVMGYRLSWARDGRLIGSRLLPNTTNSGDINLPNGNYRFTVRACNAYRMWSDPSNSVEVGVTNAGQVLRLNLTTGSR